MAGLLYIVTSFILPQDHDRSGFQYIGVVDDANPVHARCQCVRHHQCFIDIGGLDVQVLLVNLLACIAVQNNAIIPRAKSVHGDTQIASPVNR